MFKMLFSPIKIGQMELKNRIVMTGLDYLNSAEGMVAPHYIDFYVERAKGGAGLIVIGGCRIDEMSGPAQMLSIADDKFIPGLSGLVSAIQENGAKAAGQLYHAGRYARSHQMEGRQPVSSSPIPSRLTGETPRELSLREINEIQQSYCLAAARMKKAGFDAIEVLAGAGYLISQFLSPLTNRRKDEYGGSFENRMRFGVEVARAIRAKVGPEFPVTFRIAGNEFMEGGLENKEAQDFSRELEKAKVDMISVIGGWHETRVPQITMGLPRGGFAYLAQGIKQVVSIPVMASNRINDPELADRILRDGRVDLIGMARGLIADPELPNKAQTGSLDEIRYCLGCNQGCFNPSAERKVKTCLVNAQAGAEGKKILTSVSRKKRVMVIGGGPAGMEAARVAALRGHEVSLYERKKNLGGQLPLAAAPPGRNEFLTLVRYLENQMKRLRVTIHTGAEVTLRDVEKENPDAVVLATGAEPSVPEIKGVESPNVVLAWDVLAENADAGREVVIIGGGSVGLETALFLARKGTLDADNLYFLMFNQAERPETIQKLLYRGLKRITVLEIQPKVGKDFSLSNRWIFLQDLSRLGVRLVTRATAQEIGPKGVLIEVEGKKKWMAADTVVLATGVKPVDALYKPIQNLVKEIYLVGDARSPRKALEAVAEGFEAGRTI